MKIKSEHEYAASFSAALDGYVVASPRSRQTRLGISDIGTCREKTRRILAGLPDSDAPSVRAAAAGLATHAWVGQALGWAQPNLMVERRIVVVMTNGMSLPGTADFIDPDEPSVTDLKTVASARHLAYKAATGANDQQRYQRHLCYFGAFQESLVPAEGIVRNVWMSRAGDTEELVVEQEPFSLDVIEEIDEWMLHVTYAAEHGELAPRDKHAAWCQLYCQFFGDCRGDDFGDRVITTDPSIVTAARRYVEHHQLSKDHAQIAAGARAELEPLQGHDPRFEIPTEQGMLGWVASHREDKVIHRLEVRNP